MSYTRTHTFANDVRLTVAELRAQLRLIKVALQGLANADFEDDVFPPGVLAQPRARASFRMGATGRSIFVDNNDDVDLTHYWLLDYIYVRREFDFKQADFVFNVEFNSAAQRDFFSRAELDLIALPGKGHQWPLPESFDVLEQTDRFRDAVDNAVSPISRLSVPFDLLAEEQDISAPLYTTMVKRITLNRRTSPGLVGGRVAADTYLLLIARLQLDSSAPIPLPLNVTMGVTHLTVNLRGSLLHD